MAWNPQAYLKFGAERLRPALDLLANISPLGKVNSIVELGCGTGSMVPHLLSRFPGASVLAVDSSAEMLSKHPEGLPDNVLFSKVDLDETFLSPNYPWADAVSDSSSATQSSDPKIVTRLPGDVLAQKYDVIFSNATLHWLSQHDVLFPRLMQQLNPGGVLAVQIPDTRKQPSHLLMETACKNLGFNLEFQAADGSSSSSEANPSAIPVRIPRCQHDPEYYYRWISPFASEVRLWATEYVQVLSASSASSSVELPHPVADFTRTTGMKPILAALGGEGSPQAEAFELEYRRLLHIAYPQQPDGHVLMPFRRFFVVATRS